MSNLLCLPSFAKINLWLRILGKREDGFHELETVLQTLDLSDRIRFERTSESRLELTTSGRPVGPVSENLVFRAAKAFFRELGRGSGVRIDLEKRIPIGAGLGGGSSNAAITLLGLNHLYAYPLEFEEIETLAGRLGSDVPFFLYGGTALGLGRGERIVPLPDIELPTGMLLIYPGFELSTALAYSWLEAPSLPAGFRSLTEEESINRIRRFCELIETQRFGSLRNDFEAPVMKKQTQLGQLKETLEASGCERVMLSGSGSTLICLGSDSALERANDECIRLGLGESMRVGPLGGVGYRRRLIEAGMEARFFSSR